MEVCPVCKIEVEKNKNYCLECAWEFEYYFDELGEEEKERYLNRLQISQSKYTQSIDNEEIKRLEKKIIESTQKHFKELKKNIHDLKKQTKVKEKQENGRVGHSIFWVLTSTILVFVFVNIFDSNNIRFLGIHDDESGFIVGTFISIFLFFYLYIKNTTFASVEVSIYWIGISIGITISSIIVFESLNIEFLGSILYGENGIVVGSSISLILGLIMFLKRIKIKESSAGSFLQWLTFSLLLTSLSWFSSQLYFVLQNALYNVP